MNIKSKKKSVPNSIHVRKDDTVVVISGKDKGKIGKITKVYPKKGKVVVEGVNIITRATKPSVSNPRGGLVKKETPIFSCKVMVYDATAKKGTRISKKILDDGQKVRVSKKSDEQFDN